MMIKKRESKNFLFERIFYYEPHEVSYVNNYGLGIH